MSTQTLTMAEFTRRVAGETGLPEAIVKSVMQAEFDVTAEALGTGTGVPAVNGGLRLWPTERAARTGRNPRTGETIAIPVRRMVKAKVGARLARVVE